ncbi:MAG: hypothetical protein AB7H88_17695 [Vicinamibacterales bacterium]
MTRMRGYLVRAGGAGAHRPAGRRLWLLACAAVLVAGAWTPAAAQGELIERTLAIVGGQVITLSDARTALALGLVDGAGAGDPIAAAASRLVDRQLVLREVQRYAPPEPAADAVTARVAVARDRFASDTAFEQALAAGGFTRERLRAWVRDDLRIQAYLDQRFAVAGIPGDQEISAYYNAHRAEFDRGGLAFDEASRLIRDRLGAARRSELITDWISDLRRRTDVVELFRPGAR